MTMTTSTKTKITTMSNRIQTGMTTSKIGKASKVYLNIYITIKKIIY